MANYNNPFFAFFYFIWKFNLFSSYFLLWFRYSGLK